MQRDSSSPAMSQLLLAIGEATRAGDAAEAAAEEAAEAVPESPKEIEGTKREDAPKPADGVPAKGNMQEGAEYCAVCEMWLSSPEQWEDHLASAHHKKRVRREVAEKSAAAAAAEVAAAEVQDEIVIMTEAAAAMCQEA